MKAERWQRIEQLYHATLERAANQRAAFLAEASADDDGLRGEVEVLLKANEQAGGFLATPALELEARDLAAESLTAPTAVQVGEELSHYRILSRIGAGGMGDVFLARDSILERRVALKLLPVQLTQNSERLQRFVREAKAASALNHPNIITIYEIGEVVTALGKTHFIATEYIEGETLRARITDPDKHLRQTLNIAIQVASALDAAHKAGIVHRDIKPENVMVRPDGLVKVVDFGLAKLTTPPSDSVDAEARTLEGIKTRPGLILGTLRYMSPEQARGRIVDARSDIFSLGIVLYELLTGHQLFAGATDADVAAGIIHKEVPPLAEHLSHVPAGLERIIQKALAKDPAARYQSAEEIGEALRSVLAALPDADSSPVRPRSFDTGAARRRFVTALPDMLRRPRVLRSVAVAIAFAAVMLLAATLWRRDMPHQPPSEATYWYDAGTKSLSNGAYYEASKALVRAVEIDDKFVLAHARLAEAWAELDYSDKANREVLRAQSLLHDLPPIPRLERLYLQAITHVVLRELTPAIENYQQITREVPNVEKAHAYVDLGRAQEKNEEIDKAIDSFLEATRLAPSDPAAFLRLGILYGRKQNLESTREPFHRAEQTYQDLSNLEGVTEVFYQRGRLFIEMRRFAEARAQLQKALEMTTATANQYQKIRALLALSSVFASEGDARQAEEHATRAIEMAQINGIENQATGGLIWLGNSFNFRGKYGEAEKYYKQALDLARRNNGRENEAWALAQLGSMRSLQPDTDQDQALNYIEQALPFYRKGGYRKALSQSLIVLGRIYRNKGDYEGALRTFNELLELGEVTGDQSQMALSHEGIGTVLELQELYPEAFRHFDENYNINKSLNAKVYVAYAGISRANVLWQIGRYEEAKAALDEAASITQRPERSNKRLLAYIYVINGRLELSGSQFRESKTNSQQALNLAGTQYKDIAVQAKCTLGLARARSGAPREGQLLCKETVGIANVSGDPQLLSSAWLAWAEAMLESSDAQRALTTALQAQKSFARFGRQESEWRAWLIAARASQRLGEVATTIEYASHASDGLSRLEQKWGSQAYNGYLARPDVQQSLGQLGRVVKP
jgi:serine/threonine protein kinase/Tfp pilus assembly protein PilF